MVVMAGWTRAQDVIVTPIASATRDAPEQLPRLRRQLRPDFPTDLRNTPDFGYVALEFYVDEKGKSVGGRREATLPAYFIAVETALGEGLNFEAARRAGEPVNSRVRCVAIFNPASAATGKSDATPRLLDARLVVDPNRRAKPKEPIPPAEVVWATVSVNERGKGAGVSGASPELTPLFEKSLATWKFAPARSRGQPVAADVRVPFIVVSPSTGLPAGDQTPPRVTRQTRPIYPVAQRASGLRGEVLVDFVVDPEGQVTNPFVVRTLNPAFNEPALEAIRQWKFEPGRRGGVPVATHMQVPIVFQLDDGFRGGESGVTIEKKGRIDSMPEEYRYDVAPKPRGRARAVYPYALLREATTGAATVRFIIGENGKVILVDVLKTTNLEFGAAVVAAVERFEFEPALKSGRPIRSILSFEQKFERDNAELVSAADSVLLSLERKSPERIVSGTKLDSPLKPRSQRPALFPLAQIGKTQKGDAVIEFLIDEDGHARLPLIVSASDASFGYSAVQALVEWQFDPPKSGGKPVVVRVRAPFKFTAPLANVP
jgi:TonB family protein